jgi:hypothetical protein
MSELHFLNPIPWQFQLLCKQNVSFENILMGHRHTALIIALISLFPRANVSKFRWCHTLPPGLFNDLITAIFVQKSNKYSEK